MSYKRKDLAVKVNIRATKGYTMKEIGALEERIKTLEYYATLNALALETKALSIRDATGTIERFKNGIFADPFNDHTLGKTDDAEYRIAVSPSRSIARPTFEELFSDFRLEATISSNIKVKGRLALIDYDNEKFAGNQYATIYRNATEAQYRFNGFVNLYPNYDNSNQNVDNAPQNINIDIAGAFNTFLRQTKIAQNIDTVVGPVRLTGSTLVDSHVENNTRYDTTTNYYSQTTTRTITDIGVNIENINVDAGNFVTDVSNLYYMLPRRIAVIARGLKPLTKLYAFFDKVNVTDKCSPAIVNPDFAGGVGIASAAGKEDNILKAVNNYKDYFPALYPSNVNNGEIYSDSAGNAYLVFNLPANTFRSGDRILALTNVDDINAKDAIITFAEGVYTASALSTRKTKLTFNITNPTFYPTTCVEVNTANWSTTTTTSTWLSCFAAGTLVTMADGSYKEIQNVEIGDILKGKDVNNVVLGFDHPPLDDGIRDPYLYGINGGRPFITSEHPLLTKSGWKSIDPALTRLAKPHINYLDTSRLNVGDEIITDNGSVIVKSIERHEDIDKTQTVYNFVLDGDHTYYADGYLAHNRDPIAQTFTINNLPGTNIPGIYLTQLGAFFKKKSQSLGITAFVCETTNGAPNTNRILGHARKESSEVVTSDDSSGETVFTFETPVLLQSDQQYAFYLEPDFANPDYELWISEVGGIDKVSGNAITGNPFVGIMYASSTGNNWTPIQSQDIKFNLYRAKFKYLTGKAVFNNEKDDYLTTDSIIRANNSVAPAIGDVIYAANTANVNQILIDNTYYPFGIIQDIDELNNKLVIDTSTGKFSNTTYPHLRLFRVPEVGNVAYLSNTYLVANAVLKTVDDKAYHGMVPKFSILEPVGTIAEISYFGTSNSTNSFTKDTLPLKVKNESLFELSDYERVLRSYSNELAQGGYGANGSATYVIDMFTGNEYVSPVVDLSTKRLNFVKNLINNDTTNENTRYGSALNKYISKNVSLTQEAEDLLVYVTAYRPVKTDVKVYAKFQNQTDNDLFDTKEWTELVFTTTSQYTLYSSPKDREDYKELVFTLPTGNSVANSTTAYLDPNSLSSQGAADCITYFDSAGVQYYRYSTFCLKMVFLSTDPVTIPIVRDIRAIALQK
jgi:hypothetical protein